MTQSLTTTQPRMPAKRRRGEQVRRFCRRLRSLAPHLDNPAFAPLLQSYAKVLLLQSRVYEAVRAGEIVGPDGEIKTSVDSVRRLAETSARLARELGVTPLTLRALSREKNADLAASFAEHNGE
jgi:hypothetical protein